VVAFASDYSLLVGWIQEFPQGYRLLPEKLNVESLAITMPKGIQHRELREFVAGHSIAGKKRVGYRKEFGIGVCSYKQSMSMSENS
jgi:hypothetical protein